MEQNEEKLVTEFLSHKTLFYLAENEEIKFEKKMELNPKDLFLCQVNEISFEDQAPRKEALENVLSALQIEGINFVYLLLGDALGVHFYYGIVKDYYSKTELEFEIQEIGEKILKPSIQGNFRGSKVEKVDTRKKREIIESISKQEHCSILEGVPGYVEENDKYQGVDRLVDTMMGDQFGFMIIASPMNDRDIENIEANLCDMYSKIMPWSKRNIQDGRSQNKNKTHGTSEGENWSNGKSSSISNSESQNVSDATSSGTSKSTTKGKSEGGSSKSTSNSGTEGTSTNETHTEGKTTGGSKTQGESQNSGGSRSTSKQEASGEGTSTSSSVEFVNKSAQNWLQYLDDVILPRLDYGTGKGVFIAASFLFSDSKVGLKKLENTAISLYSGENGNKVPLRAVHLEKSDNLKRQREDMKTFQLSHGKFTNKITQNERESHSVLSHYITSEGNVSVGNWITTNELSLIAGLPKKEVVGLGLREEVEFGLNFKEENADRKEQIVLGKLVQSGNIIDKDVSIDKKNLDKHIFVTGVTGSGKTTTCHQILIDSGYPFMVIEPAKTEYRILKKEEDFKDLLIFTLGENSVAPFRLNPFEFFPHENITSRVDMICASMKASFDMDAAIPQLLETAIYECYKDYGWNIATNKNSIYGEHAFDEGVYSFPTLQDLYEKTEKVVVDQGFTERLRDEYIGSIRARLNGMMAGAKGLMLNTPRSIDFSDLLDRKVVLELEEIRSGNEKSLIMGFVLVNLSEAIKRKYLETGVVNHITLVEEAHRLLSKYTPGDSLNQKQGVETFTDMLAEIRKYGGSLIIVDQIPNKLTPEILKNTNTKIVHRLFAEDDKEAIGNTIALEKEQKDFLSKLGPGRAVVFSQGFDKAIQVQIKNSTNTTSEEQIAEEEIRKTALGYYREHYKRGIIPGSQFYEKQPNVETIQKLFSVESEDIFGEILQTYLSERKVEKKHYSEVKSCIQKYGLENVVWNMLAQNLRNKNNRLCVANEDLLRTKKDMLQKFLEKYQDETLEENGRDGFYRNFKDIILEG